MSFNFKDSIWFIGIIVALGATWGMMSQRVTALEKDVGNVEEAIIMFTKMETRLAVIETEVKNINKKLDAMTR
ncbi:MAG TPA: hypothetical protein QF698_05490 [Candidatus Marinimicrobia bacterium]|jgi:hypothetical protein|nr:hypothetical protein [Candidatus Neomarinimicrobiota bacterium]|tara:strand:- start:481 stop:699 length:219 start_codon:yes stop_codon:yes gene_type:complete